MSRISPRAEPNDNDQACKLLHLEEQNLTSGGTERDRAIGDRREADEALLRASDGLDKDRDWWAAGAIAAKGRPRQNWRQSLELDNSTPELFLKFCSTYAFGRRLRAAARPVRLSPQDQAVQTNLPMGQTRPAEMKSVRSDRPRRTMLRKDRSISGSQVGMCQIGNDMKKRRA